MKQWILLKPQDTNTPSADCDSECLNIGECRQWAKGTQDIYDIHTDISALASPSSEFHITGENTIPSILT